MSAPGIGPRLGLPDLGFGVGLRPQHLPAILAGGPRVGRFEIISENYLDHAGYGRAMLDRLAETVPIAMHGVSLSIGSDEPLDGKYLARIGRLADEVRAAWISDHLCWTGLGSHNSHDLLPLPLNGRTLCGDVLIDTHDKPVPAPVWELYALARSLTGGVSTLLEWDADIPEYDLLLAELDKARHAAAGPHPAADGPAVAAGALSTPIHFHLERNADADAPRGSATPLMPRPDLDDDRDHRSGRAGVRLAPGAG